jgi:hypothetical protein
MARLIGSSTLFKELKGKFTITAKGGATLDVPFSIEITCTNVVVISFTGTASPFTEVPKTDLTNGALYTEIIIPVEDFTTDDANCPIQTFKIT